MKCVFQPEFFHINRVLDIGSLRLNARVKAGRRRHLQLLEPINCGHRVNGRRGPLSRSGRGRN